jgi:hypothetical protein
MILYMVSYRSRLSKSNNGVIAVNEGNSDSNSEVEYVEC